MKKNIGMAIGFLLLVSLVVTAIWANVVVDDIQGPTRLVKGPEDSIYVLSYDKILKVSNEGDVLLSYDLDSDLHLSEPVSDIYVEPNGEILIGLTYSQQIRIYSPDGKFLRTHPRKPSLLSNEQSLDFRFTKDPDSGRLYVADTYHHKIQIYDGDGNEIGTLTDFSGTSLRYPNGLVFENGHLFVTDRDRSRVLVLDSEGGIKREIKLPTSLRSLANLPLRISPYGEDLFVLTRPPLPLPGREVHIVYPESKYKEPIDLSKDPQAAIAQAMELDRGPSRIIHKGDLMDLQDVLARPEDVLIADLQSMKILRFSHHGESLDPFEKNSLERVFSEIRTKRRMLELIYPGSMAGAGIVLLAFLIALRKERKAAPSLETPYPLEAREKIQAFLGPKGSPRRRMLLVLIPGLGQVAAGKDFRAFLYTVPFFLFLALAIQLILAYFFDITVLPDIINQVAIMTAILCVAIHTWVLMAVDGLRLDASGGSPPKALPLKEKILWSILPFGSGLLGAGAQFAQNYLIRSFSVIEEAMKTRFIALLAFIKGSSLFAVIYADVLSSNLIAWGTATAFIFGSVSWRISSKKSDALVVGLLGLVAGPLLWILSVASCGALFDNYQTGSLIIFPVQGLVVGLTLYLVAGPSRLSFLIVPASLSATWIGLVIAALMLYVGIPISGASLVYMAVVPWFMHQSILRVTISLESAQSEGKIEQLSPPALLKRAGWVSLSFFWIVAAAAYFSSGPMTVSQQSVLTERLVLLRNTENLALEELARLGDEEKLKLVPELISTIKNNPGPVAYYGSKAATALSRIGPIAIPELIKALGDSDDSVRYFSAKSLALMGSEAKPAVPVLAKNLKDKDDTVRYGTAEFLGMIGPAAEEAIPALIDTLQNDTYDLAREHAAMAIGKIGTQSPEVMSALLGAVKDSDHDVASKSTEALIPMGEKAVPGLTELLKSSEKTIRYRAISALAGIGPGAKNAGPSFLPLLKDDDEGIRTAAERALAKIDPNLTLPVDDLIILLTQGDEKKRISATFALGKKGEEAASALIPLIRDENAEIRFLVINALGMVGPPALKTIPALKKLGKDKETYIRGNAAWALGRINPASPPGAETVIEQLAAIDKLVEGPHVSVRGRKYTDNGMLLVHAIERLENLETKYSQSPEIDDIWFRLGDIKSAIGDMMDFVDGDTPETVYINKHRDEYDYPYLAVVYKGTAFKHIIDEYPESPFVDDAEYALAINNTKGGECEGDFNCRVHRSVGTLLPFIKNYPNSPKVSDAISWINEYILMLTIHPDKYGDWVEDVSSESRQLLDEYHRALMNVQDLRVRSAGLYPLAWTFLRDNQSTRADSIFKDLLENYPNLENRNDVERAREEIKALSRNS